MLRRSTNNIITAILLDVACISIAVALATWLRLNLPYGQPLSIKADWKILWFEALLLYPVIFLLFSLYDPEHKYRVLDEYQIVVGACLMGALSLAGLVYFTAREISRLYLVYFYALHFLSVILWRGAASLLWKNQNALGRDLRRVLLLGGGESARQALERLHELAWAGVQLVGYLTDGDPIPAANGEIPQLGNLDSVERVANENAVHDILIALPAENYNKIQQLMPRLIDQPCNIWVVPDYFSLLIYGAQVEELGDVPMISLKGSPLSGYQRVIKRAFDLVIGSITFIFTLPLMGAIALAIKLDTRGPAIFRQQRVGENGRLFLMYKFRSMEEGADDRLADVMRLDENGNLVHKLPDDPRVTRVGQFIRKTSLDELPQFINVIRGEMSLVGPRPELPIFVEKYQPWQHKRLAVPQGITGWWQINGRSAKPMHLHTEDDIYYVQNYTLLLDIEILVKTITAVLRRKGAF